MALASIDPRLLARLARHERMTRGAAAAPPPRPCLRPEPALATRSCLAALVEDDGRIERLPPATPQALLRDAFRPPW